MISLSHHFLTKDRARQLEQARQSRWFIKARADREKREDLAEQAQDAVLAMAMDTMAATEARLHAFEAKMEAYEVRLDRYEARLDIYDEAVTSALMQRLAQLDALRAEERAMLDSAFKLEDGRKVFKSEDGTFAVFEGGKRMGENEFNAVHIADGEYSAEDYLAVTDGIKSTRKEIDRLHKAQSDIDVARDKLQDARTKLDGSYALLEKDGVTELELDEFEQEMEAMMPSALPTLPAAALQSPGQDALDEVPAATAAFTMAVNELSPQSMPRSAPNAHQPELGG